MVLFRVGHSIFPFRVVIQPFRKNNFYSGQTCYFFGLDERDPFRRDFRQLIHEFRSLYKSRFLVKIGEKYRSVPTGEISRECIVNIDSIALMYSYSSGRLQLTLKNREKSDLFIVSRDKVAGFKKWIDR